MIQWSYKNVLLNKYTEHEEKHFLTEQCQLINVERMRENQYKQTPQ